MNRSCKWKSIEGKPGYQWCPVCKKARGYPLGQTRPSELNPNLYRECTGPPAGQENRDTPLPIPVDIVNKLAENASKFKMHAIKIQDGPCGGCNDKSKG